MELNHHRAGSGEPLVLIHGIGSRWQMWEPVLDRVEAEREVIALDLPGFAGSPPPPAGTPATIGSLTRLVAAFIDGLGLERPHVAGNSLGGWIALELAGQGRVRSATALSPLGFQNGPEAAFAHGSLWLAVRAARLIGTRVRRFAASPLRRKLAFGQLVARPEQISAEDVAASVRALAQAPWFDAVLARITAERFTAGDRITVPVTVAWGDHDRLLLPRQSLRAGRAIPSAKLVTLSGCGHVPTYDDPEQVARALLDGSCRN